MIASPFTIIIVVLATFLGIILKAYSNMAKSGTTMNQSMFGTLMQIIFLVSLSILWIMIFSKVLA
jgi:hypothetical protein